MTANSMNLASAVRQLARPLAGNQRALDSLTAEKKLEIVPEPGYLFEEPGTLDIVARSACEWFGRHLHEPAPAGFTSR
jgi:hypothetical protein